MLPFNQRKAAALAAVLACATIAPANGGIVEGVYRGSDTWLYLDRFVFVPASTEDDKGLMTITLDFPDANTSNPALMLFYKGDEEQGVQREFGLWERAYSTDLLCEEKALVAQQKGGIYIPLPGNRPLTRYVDEEGVPRWSVTVTTRMTTNRARWMFITVGNCQPGCGSQYCSNSLDFRYNMTLTNGSGSSRYFSGEKFWFHETAILFVVLYALLTPVMLHTRYALIKERKYHHSVVLLVFSIVTSAASSACYLAFYSSFASSGYESRGVMHAAVVFELLGDFSLLLMTILVAKGWTIVRRKISALGRVRIATYMTLYVVASAACWIYYLEFSDPAEILYLYATIPGMILVFLRIFALGWFSYAMHVTRRKYRQKRHFYQKYWVFVGAWIFTLPVLVALNNIVEMWYRDKIVNLLAHLSTFVCQAVLIVMYSPQAPFGVNRHFPFHATTTDALLRSSGSQSGTNKREAVVAGANTFDEAHLLRAFQLSQQMRHSVVMLQSYTNDLHAFLDGIRRERQQPGQPSDLEKGLLSAIVPGGSGAADFPPSKSAVRAASDGPGLNSSATAEPSASGTAPAPRTTTPSRPSSRDSARSVVTNKPEVGFGDREEKVADAEGEPLERAPVNAKSAESGSHRARSRSAGTGASASSRPNRNEAETSNLGSASRGNRTASASGTANSPGQDAVDDTQDVIPRRRLKKRHSTSSAAVGGTRGSAAHCGASGEGGSEEAGDPDKPIRPRLRRKSTSAVSRKKSAAPPPLASEDIDDEL